MALIIIREWQRTPMFWVLAFPTYVVSWCLDQECRVKIIAGWDGWLKGKVSLVRCCVNVNMYMYGCIKGTLEHTNNGTCNNLPKNWNKCNCIAGYWQVCIKERSCTHSVITIAHWIQCHHPEKGFCQFSRNVWKSFPTH